MKKIGIIILTLILINNVYAYDVLIQTSEIDELEVLSIHPIRSVRSSLAPLQNKIILNLINYIRIFCELRTGFLNSARKPSPPCLSNIII